MSHDRNPDYQRSETDCETCPKVGGLSSWNGRLDTVGSPNPVGGRRWYGLQCYEMTLVQFRISRQSEIKDCRFQQLLSIEEAFHTRYMKPIYMPVGLCENIRN